ncbi:D-TA family PLP-dependent enzyme [Cesiribacter andamanensis]|uniref:D-threonine aldolase n=1 Tax=Cesiribacter andamanensis AMV16 TaxID=1279009 RepID=M7NRJ0_9BACT|nr:D-TA family PLP-dependent enzyme [Cesiribacter andamanensis]EMR04295.1 D-threonine aldolase [Cesiribacter andamanensis AMV16]
MTPPWYTLANVAELDSPSLLLYKDRIQHNIGQMIALAGSCDRLMVHVKTTKMPEVVKMLLAAGISRFKCATIAEAEMVCQAGGNYLVLAHQLVGPKVDRFIRLRQRYPQVFMASLLDCRSAADAHQQAFARAGLVGHVLLDVNNGMNRSGHPLDGDIFPLYQYLHQQPNLHCHGLHVYDGHWRTPDFEARKKSIEQDFKRVEMLMEQIAAAGLPSPMLIAGGTPAFTTHRLREDTFCSPGTCVLWDWGYGDALREQPFQYAALLLTRIISKPAPGIVTIDLGHKGVAAENPIDKRVRFLNLQDWELLSQSEEHGVLRVQGWDALQVGDVLYGVPYHICPTVNLYDEAYVVEEGKATARWEVLARRRRLEV